MSIEINGIMNKIMDSDNHNLDKMKLSNEKQII